MLGDAMKKLARRVEGAILGAWRRIPPLTRLPGLRTIAPRENLRARVTPRSGDRRLVVLIASRRSYFALQSWMRTFRGDRIIVFSSGYRPAVDSDVAVTRVSRPADIHQELRRHEPPDLIIDTVRRQPKGTAHYWRNLYLHTPLDGFYTHRTPAGRVRRGADAVGIVTTLPPENAVSGRDVEDLAAATRSVTVVGKWTVYEKGLRHYLKVPERIADILPTRAPELRITELAELPPVSFTPRGSLHSHRSTTQIPHLNAAFEVPPLRMRRFEGRIRHLGQMATASDHTLLPPSFTINEISSVRLARNITADFASLPAGLQESAATLAGTYYDMNPAWFGHYGHFITEIPAKLWGWDRARAEHPDLKAIVSIRPDYVPSYERELLHAYGIADDDIHWSREPVTLESYIACTPMWHNTAPHFVHPAITQTWDRLTDALANTAVISPERLFVARKRGMAHRDCRNAAEVEALFEAAGFRFVHPEEHTLAEQASLFAGARVVAGFGGSGLFNVLFARNLETLIVLNHEAYTARNEYLFAAALGADTHYFWSAADREQPADRFSDTAFHSGWEFDFERNGDDLAKLLSSL